MILIPKYKDTLQISGALSLVLTDTTKDKVKQEIYVPNLVVTSGKVWIASRMIGTTDAVMGWMGLGTGSTNDTASAAALAMTGLGTVTAGVGSTEIINSATGTIVTGYVRPVVTATNPSTSTNSVQYISTFVAGNPSTAAGALLREAAIFNAAGNGVNGTMLCRTVFPLVTKMPNDSLTITWTITIN